MGKRIKKIYTHWNGHLLECTSTGAERGATILEFVLAFPIFLFIILGIVDLSRYFAAVAVLNAGAHEGLMVATKIPNLDLDTREVDANSEDYKRFTLARDFVTSAAVTIPFGSIIGEAGSNDPIRLNEQEMTDELVGGTAALVPAQGVAVLRPGECAVSMNGTKLTCNNETLNPNDYPTPAPTPTTPPAAAAPTPISTPAKPITPPQTLMRSHPIKIVLTADVQSYLPFFSGYTAVGSANGYREKDIPEGPAAGEEPLPVALPVVTPEPPGTLPQAIDEEEPEQFVTCAGGLEAAKNAAQFLKSTGFPRAIGPDPSTIGDPGSYCQPKPISSNLSS